MTLVPILSRLADALRRLACRLQEARRLRRDLAQLALMSERELLDIGLARSSFGEVVSARSC